MKLPDINTGEYENTHLYILIHLLRLYYHCSAFIKEQNSNSNNTNTFYRQNISKFTHVVYVSTYK